MMIVSGTILCVVCVMLWFRFVFISYSLHMWNKDKSIFLQQDLPKDEKWILIMSLVIFAVAMGMIVR